MEIGGVRPRSIRAWTSPRSILGGGQEREKNGNGRLDTR